MTVKPVIGRVALAAVAGVATDGATRNARAGIADPPYLR